MLLQAAKCIGAEYATIRLAGAGIGIGEMCKRAFSTKEKKKF